MSLIDPAVDLTHASISSIPFRSRSIEKRVNYRIGKFCRQYDKALLHYLAESGKEDVLRVAIERFDFNVREAVRSKDRNGKTPLHYAAEFGIQLLWIKIQRLRESIEC